MGRDLALHHCLAFQAARQVQARADAKRISFGLFYLLQRTHEPLCSPLCTSQARLSRSTCESWYNTGNVEAVRQMVQDFLEGVSPGV